MEVVKVDMDLVGTKAEKQVVKYMSAGYSYLISAVGQPSRISDLDIEVYYLVPEENGESVLVALDKKTDNTPAVTLNPTVSGTYIIKVKAASMRKGYEDTMGFYFLIVAHN